MEHQHYMLRGVTSTLSITTYCFSMNLTTESVVNAAVKTQELYGFSANFDENAVTNRKTQALDDPYDIFCIFHSVMLIS